MSPDMDKKVIRFVGNAAPYFAGDVAGFDALLAERYIAAGLAIEVPLGPSAATPGQDPAPSGQTASPAPARKQR